MKLGQTVYITGLKKPATIIKVDPLTGKPLQAITEEGDIINLLSVAYEIFTAVKQFIHLIKKLFKK